MGEALISRFGGGSAEVEINNQTKQILGLPSDADLNDALQSLAYRSSDYATVMVEVVENDGTACTDAKVRMQESDGTNTTYTADDYGKFIFKTNKAQATFVNDEEYFDVKPQSQTIDTVVGSVKSLKITRNHYNASEARSIVSTCNIKFSNKINTATVTLVGGGGGSWSGYTTAECGATVHRKEVTVYPYCNWSHARTTTRGGHGYSNSKTITITPLQEYRCIIGTGGTGGSGADQYSGSADTNVGYGRGFDQSLSSTYSNGSAGGTTSAFGLSANGGRGGTYNTNGTGGSGNSLGGNGGNTSSGYGTARGYYSGWMYYFSANVSASGAGGNRGFVFINNFRYK